MTSFDLSNIPPAYARSEALSMQDLNGLMRVHLQRSLQRPLQRSLRRYIASLPGICFTKIDQAFIIWGLLCTAIFSFAQFSALSWTTQAIIDGFLTAVGVATTSGLTWKLASDEGLRWVIFLWAGLMSLGIVATTYGIFGGVAVILSHLCLLWLSLCVAGYGAMAVGMQSRSFSAACVFHVVAIAMLDYQPGWQFLNSGIVMATTLFFFSVVPWDMQASDNDIPC
ncbi:MAG: hypothetical protein AAFS04_20990 [Cyanobacteria bacterium J06631_9]